MVADLFTPEVQQANRRQNSGPTFQQLGIIDADPSYLKKAIACRNVILCANKDVFFKVNLSTTLGSALVYCNNPNPIPTER